jgi:hypothetical protein
MNILGAGTEIYLISDYNLEMGAIRSIPPSPDVIALFENQSLNRSHQFPVNW